MRDHHDNEKRASVIKLGKRYFYRITTGHRRSVLTAWSLAGATTFLLDDYRLTETVERLKKLGKSPRVVEVRTACDLVMLACGKCGRTAHLERDMIADLLGCGTMQVEEELAKEEDAEPSPLALYGTRRAFTCPWCGFDGPETYHMGLPEAAGAPFSL